MADISRLKDAVKHRWAAETAARGPFTELSDRKEGRVGLHRLAVACCDKHRELCVSERTAANFKEIYFQSLCKQRHILKADSLTEVGF